MGLQRHMAQSRHLDYSKTRILGMRCPDHQQLTNHNRLFHAVLDG
jgi:hypothetical protein